MLTRAAGMAAAFVAGLALVVAAVLVVRHLTEPSEPELPVVPDTRRPVLEAAVRGACSPLSVPLLAAQIDAESGWRPDADSGHAQGISQFSPVTWKEWGKDGNGDGKADVWEPRDAIPSQARYMCHLYEVVKAVPGSGTRLGSTRLALAAYNAGPNAVLRARGIPKILETQEYVDKILTDLLPKYEESEERYQRSEAKHRRTDRASAAPSAPSSPSPSTDPSATASGVSPSATRQP
ncbi:lytic transglycosylase domain-containing protein [Streptomyces samsunensis]|uniref:Lytic transglycosylase domain-containing protein n=1 Tax=Streptomyces malaysiensis TaxID=92644 RepID=A0ABX6W3C7_STRMQ|nr:MULTISPECIES: lytic transglycosylase domain-containing protein [Streptomyces]MYU12859.1 transglycosylase SLT domain-containing protein [Streptomyces sp. SID8361]NUH38222.1 lytic transglycosylase domain-containing protein [Streptomyces samsunensis]QPI56010.1 lytic transglycosylase domain-containing protein [Streptomyces solisilvae]UHH17480.1 lytic transglycosylase domain-containing protein [Streptomyces sp. HNM0561]SCF95741.1 Transglycosylase SLT domain-containing protein [Streptomyces sp. M